MSSINSTSSLQLNGSACRLEDYAKNKGKPVVPYKMTEDQIKEGKAWEEQTRLRREAVDNYAKAHPNPVVGQVLVNGKVFATVFSPGGVALAHALPGMSDAQLSPEDRLAEIARLTKGEIRHSDFLPDWSGGDWSGFSTIPDEVMATMPKVTARGLNQMRPEEGLAVTLSEAFERLRMQRATDAASKKDE